VKSDNESTCVITSIFFITYSVAILCVIQTSHLVGPACKEQVTEAYVLNNVLQLEDGWAPCLWLDTLQCR
jgi:hypothetical protein